MPKVLKVLKYSVRLSPQCAQAPCPIKI